MTSNALLIVDEPINAMITDDAPSAAWQHLAATTSVSATVTWSSLTLYSRNTYLR